MNSRGWLKDIADDLGLQLGAPPLGSSRSASAQRSVRRALRQSARAYRALMTVSLVLAVATAMVALWNQITGGSPWTASVLGGAPVLTLLMLAYRQARDRQELEIILTLGSTLDDDALRTVLVALLETRTGRRRPERGDKVARHRAIAEGDAETSPASRRSQLPAQAVASQRRPAPPETEAELRAKPPIASDHDANVE